MEETDMLIRVSESEFKPLLDRNKTLEDLKNLVPWIHLIRDVTSYGSNLIPRCFCSSERNLRDVVVLSILLRQVVAMLDGVEILLSNGAVYAANLQMRALFEAAVYIEWILQDDSERKAAYYYVHNLRRKRTRARLTQPGSHEAQESQTVMNESIVQIDFSADEEMKNRGRELIQDIDRVLSQPAFADIDRDFEKLRKRNKRDREWHVPLGQLSFRAVARSVRMGSLYASMYSIASEVMHGSSYEQHVTFGKGQVTFQPIRFLKGFEDLLRFSVSIAFSTYRNVLGEYRKDELPAFSRKYIEKWQKPFMNFPQITYDEKVATKI